MRDVRPPTTPPAVRSISVVVALAAFGFGAVSALIALAKARDARFESGAELAMAVAAADQGTLPDLLVRRARKPGHTLPWTEPEIVEHKAS